LPAPSADARAHSDRLIQATRKEIEAAGGWIGFARFMQLALYAQELGYYVAGATKLATAIS
jgi:SAM-dependent MidA family methyltransferase